MPLIFPLALLLSQILQYAPEEPGTLCEQVQTPDGAHTAALRYAPWLRFAAGEMNFPTLPFFCALDGKDNDGDGQIDFADVDEIVPRVAGGQPVWKALDNLYASLTEEEKVSVAAGFYRVRTDVSAHRVRNILRTDGPRYHRLRPDTKAFLDDGDSRFLVFEYYFYYVNDQGITGHPEDIEFFYVFVPCNEAFLVLAGGAHSEGDGNNVAIYESTTGRLPGVTAAIELGGHAMAPDVPPFGEFQPGADINWHFEDGWGIRDTMARAGSGSLGRYRPWMTELRTRGNVLLGPPRATDAARRELAEDRPAPTYLLLPVDLVFGEQGLYANWSALDLPAARTALQTLAANLDRPAATMTSASDLSEEGLHRLAMWSADGIRDEGSVKPWPAAKHDVSRHAVYTASSPTVIFKPHLFTPKVIPYPFARLHGDDGGKAQVSPGLAMQLPLFGIRGKFSLRGALELSAEYRESEARDFMGDVTYVRTLARRFTWLLSVRTNLEDGQIGLGGIGRLNPNFVFDRMLRLEGRAGVYWEIDGFLAAGPRLEISIGLPGFPWGPRRQ